MSAPITLDKADFYELLSLLRLQEVLRLELRQKQAEFTVAGMKGHTCMTALGEKYGFDASKDYGFDEQTYALIPRSTG